MEEHSARRTGGGEARHDGVQVINIFGKDGADGGSKNK